MVTIVQLVRASDCGSECRGFESHWSHLLSCIGKLLEVVCRCFCCAEVGGRSAWSRVCGARGGAVWEIIANFAVPNRRAACGWAL